MKFQTISAAKLNELIQNDAHIIDVRSPGEYKAAHVESAQSHPLDALEPQKVAQQSNGQAIYILCQSGKRAELAAKKFIEAGYSQAVVVTGGTQAAITEKVPIIKGRGSISIERQVRITAGAIVCIGTLLGIWVHSGFLALPAFIGAGLTFSGLTDTCGMAAVLAKCPWNQ